MGHRAHAANLAGEPPEKVAAVTSRDAARKRKERDMRIDFELSGGGPSICFGRSREQRTPGSRITCRPTRPGGAARDC